MTKQNHKNKPLTDWDPWDIKAALGKRGYTLAKIARETGHASTSPNQALYRPWAAMEQIIASFLDTKPWDIWPSRYDSKHQPLLYRKTKTRRVRAPTQIA